MELNMGPPNRQRGIADLPVTARCSGYQGINGLAFAPFLQRGCNRAPPPTAPISDKLAYGRFLIGVSPTGYLVVARCHNRQKRDLEENTPNVCCFDNHLLVSIYGAMLNTTNFIPFSTLFSSKRLLDLKLVAMANRPPQYPEPLPSKSPEMQQEDALLRQLLSEGLEHRDEGNLLDQAVAFRYHDLNTSRSTRYLPWESQPHSEKQEQNTVVRHPYFIFPAFGVTGQDFSNTV